MGKPETSIAELCAELDVTRQTLYRDLTPTDELRAKRCWWQNASVGANLYRATRTRQAGSDRREGAQCLRLNNRDPQSLADHLPGVAPLERRSHWR
jgi:predicted DNA-binding transcriptional regulator YafY